MKNILEKINVCITIWKLDIEECKWQNVYRNFEDSN